MELSLINEEWSIKPAVLNTEAYVPKQQLFSYDSLLMNRF